MSGFQFSPARARRGTVACLALLWCWTGSIGATSVFGADDQLIKVARGSLMVRPLVERLQIIEWIGPSSTTLAWPQLDQHRYTLLSLRVVPKGLQQVGVVAALTPTVGLNLAGVALSDDDLGFLVKRCHGVSLLRLRHPSTLSQDEFGDLTDEERAELKTRTLTGDGLTQLQRLKRLVLLEISGYSLSATRLQFLAELRQLRWLALCDMKITDDDLQALDGFPNLTKLDLSGTSVTGSGLRHLRNCPALAHVILNRTPVTSKLAEVLKENPLPHLRQLEVSGCKLLPGGLFSLRNAVPLFAKVDDTDYSLQSLASITPPSGQNAQDIRFYRAACQLLWGFDIAGFRTAGTTVADVSIRKEGWISGGDWVLPCLSPLKGLKNLWLCGISLSEESLEQLRDHDQLEWLDLSGSTVADAGLKHLVGLKRLRGLNLRKTHLTDTGLDSLAQLPHLESLFLSGTDITDHGMPALRSHWHLRSLDLKGCKIGDQGLREICDMPNLEFIRLDETQVTDRGLRALAELPSLRGVSCTNCKITDAGVAKLLRLDNLAYCQMEGTSVTRKTQTALTDHVSTVRATLQKRYPSTRGESWDLWGAASSN